MTEKPSQEFPLDLKRKWKPPKIHFEFLSFSIPTAFREVHAKFFINKKFELIAVGDEVGPEDSGARVLTLVFKEAEKPKPCRRAFSLKKEWELDEKGFQTLDTVKKGELK